MRFVDPTKPYRKSGGWGTRGFVALSAEDKKCPVSSPAVLSTSVGLGSRRRPPLCHPDRSGGICGSLNRHLIRIEAPPSPLSSRPKWRDLQFSQPVSDSNRSSALPFVIPTEVEGSAVLSPASDSPPSPLSSRPKWRDLQFSQPAADSNRSSPPCHPGRTRISYSRRHQRPRMRLSLREAA